MQFKNLSFITHPVLEGIMAQVICNNGKRLSVVAGEGTYSSSKDGVRAAVSEVEDVSSFEVMIFSINSNPRTPKIPKRILLIF